MVPEVIAAPDTLPAVEMVANFESAIAAEALILESLISVIVLLSASMVLLVKVSDELGATPPAGVSQPMLTS
jgi:hypothetical protein